MLSTYLNLLFTSEPYPASMTVIPFPGRRLAARQAEIPAHIARTDGEPLPCTLLNLTWRGALVNTTKIVLPNAFTLLLNGQGLTKRKCRVIWREWDVVGVEFEA